MDDPSGWTLHNGADFASLAKAIGMLPPGSSASLWALLILSLPPGVLLLTGAAAPRNPTLETK